VIDIMSLTITKGVKVRIVCHHAGKTGTVVKVTEKMCSIWVGLQSDPIRVIQVAIASLYLYWFD